MYHIFLNTGLTFLDVHRPGQSRNQNCLVALRRLKSSRLTLCGLRIPTLMAPTLPSPTWQTTSHTLVARSFRFSLLNPGTISRRSLSKLFSAPFSLSSWTTARQSTLSSHISSIAVLPCQCPHLPCVPHAQRMYLPNSEASVSQDS